MDNKNITILIPAYNPTKDLIPLTIGLLENNFNVVVVNDGSKEEANEIFNELSEKITAYQIACYDSISRKQYLSLCVCV